MVDALNIRETRAAAHAAAGHENAAGRAGITDTTEGRIVTRATERLRENDWRKALDTLGQEEPADLHWGGWQDIVPGQVFTAVNGAGERVARPGSNEAARRTDIARTMTAYDALIQNGYNSLLIGSAERTRVDTIINATINGSPQLTELYTNGGVIDTARVAGLMNEPGMKKYLAAALNEVYDPAKRFNMLDVQKAAEAYAKANNELTALNTEKTAADAAAAITDANWDAVLVGGIDRGTRMNNLKTAFAAPTIPAGHGLTATGLATRIRDIQNFQRNLEERNDFMKRRVVDHAAVQRLNDRLDSARIDPTYGPQLAEYQNLYESRVENAAKRTEGEKKSTELTGKIAEKTADVNVKRSEEQDKLRDARAHSTKFEQSIKRALGKAAKNTVSEKVGVFMNGYRASETESLDLAKQEHAHHISDEVQRRLTKTTRRWVNYLPGTGWLGNNKREILNEGQIRKDARVLLKGGPEALVRQVLKSANVPNGEQELLLRDPEFMKQQGKEIYGKVLAGYMMTGGKIPQSQYEALSMSSWGPEVLTEMISKNAEAKAMIEQHTGQPYTEKSIRDLLADPNNQKWIKRALLTAGGLGLFYAGPAGIATAVGAVGEVASYLGGHAAGMWADAAKDYIVDPLVAGEAGKTVGQGIDAVVGGAKVAGKVVADNVAAIGSSTALQTAGAEVGKAMGTADTALRAGTVGKEIGEAAKYIADTASTTADVIAKNAVAAKAVVKP